MTLRYSEDTPMRSSQAEGKSALKYDYSGIFNVKEEYIFIFSGYSDQGGLQSSVEVFDTQRDIWRTFGNNISAFGDLKEATAASNICNKRQKFEALSFYNSSMGCSDSNSTIQKDIIHLVGGRD